MKTVLLIRHNRRRRPARHHGCDTELEPNKLGA